MSDQEKEILDLSEDIEEDGEEQETADAVECGEPDGDAAPQEQVCEAGSGEEAKEDGEISKKESKLFKKKAKADKKQDALKEKIEELEDKVKRQMAEFDNFRKRSEKEKSAMFETGAKSVIEKILPVVDNFERGLQGLSEEEAKEPFAEGMNMIYKQLMAELDNLGVKPIEAVGQEFNPDLHNAVMQVESEEFESGVIAQELQKGYTYRDTVVRHSMVGVAQ